MLLFDCSVSQVTNYCVRLNCKRGMKTREQWFQTDHPGPCQHQVMLMLNQLPGKRRLDIMVLQ
jgi:hypothetical protein